MNMSVILSRARNSLNAYSDAVLEIVDDTLLYHYADQAVLEIKRELRRPIKERDYPMTVGERGIQLDEDFMDLVDEHAVRIIQVSSDDASEGTYFPISDDMSMGV